MNIFYCDHAATTGCLPEVWELMGEYALRQYGNANSFHRMGWTARKAVERGRAQIAEILGASASEMVFTSGGTESIGLALRGAARINAGAGRRHIVTSATEHEASLRVCEELEREGYDVTRLRPDAQGVIAPEQVEDAISEDTCVVSVMQANNETGTIQPIAAIASAIRRRKPGTLFHVDAVQSVGHMPVAVKELDVDLLSFTAHKFYGPKGIGGLYVRQGTWLQTSLGHGSDACGLRAGTESVPLIVGMAAALKAACEKMQAEADAWRKFRDEVEVLALQEIPNCRVNGGGAERLSHFTHLSVQHVEGEDLVLALDRVGIEASSGAACNLARNAGSHVLEAMGLPRSWARGSLRLTFGHGSRNLDAKTLVQSIAKATHELRSLCPPTSIVLKRRRQEKIASEG